MEKIKVDGDGGFDLACTIRKGAVAKGRTGLGVPFLFNREESMNIRLFSKKGDTASIVLGSADVEVSVGFTSAGLTIFILGSARETIAEFLVDGHGNVSSIKPLG